MILKVNKDICEIKQNEVWNVGDYNVHTVEVELSEEFDGLVNKVRYFVEDNSYDMLITSNVAQVPYEATLTEGTIKIGVYGYDADTNILVQSTSPVNKYISSGTYTGEADNTEPLTPTDKQQMESAIQKNTDDIIDLQNNKQDVLTSGQNIKTINNESLLGEGNKSLNDLGIQPAGNYALRSEIPTVPTNVSSFTNDAGYTTNIGTITSIKMNGNTISSSGEANLGTVITSHQDISGKLDASKVKNTYSTTSGDVYDVTYINSTIGNIESLLTEV